MEFDPKEVELFQAHGTLCTHSRNFAKVTGNTEEYVLKAIDMMTASNPKIRPQFVEATYPDGGRKVTITRRGIEIFFEIVDQAHRMMAKYN